MILFILHEQKLILEVPLQTNKNPNIKQIVRTYGGLTTNTTNIINNYKKIFSQY